MLLTISSRPTTVNRVFTAGEFVGLVANQKHLVVRLQWLTLEGHLLHSRRWLTTYDRVYQCPSSPTQQSTRLRLSVLSPLSPLRVHTNNVVVVRLRFY